jgi:hypothetical protein
MSAINGGCTDKAKVHIEPCAHIFYLLSNTTGSTFTDSCLYFPIDVAKRVKFEAIWEAVFRVSQRVELIFTAASQTSGPEFKSNWQARLVGRTDTRECGSVGCQTGGHVCLQLTGT